MNYFYICMIWWVDGKSTIDGVYLRKYEAVKHVYSCHPIFDAYYTQIQVWKTGNSKSKAVGYLDSKGHLIKL